MDQADNNRELDSASSHLESLVLHLQEQLDRRIEVQHRELANAKELLTDKVEAVDERIGTIFREQRHALQTAEQEREKAASEIRVAMERLISEGDQNLERHIEAQIQSIQAALTAQEKLGDEKDKRLEAIHASSQEAITKAEVGMERRLNLLNEFREQLRDQASQFLPREVHEAALAEVRREMKGVAEHVAKVEAGVVRNEVYTTAVDEWSTWRATVNDFVAKFQGASGESQRNEARFQPWALWAAGALVTVFITIVVVFVNLLTAQ